MNQTTSRLHACGLAKSVFVVALFAASLFAGRAVAQGRTCGLPLHDPSTMPVAMFTASDCSYNSTNPTSAYAATTVYRIPVVVHVLQRASGTGALTDARIRSQIDVLNEDFRALPGTNGAPGVDTGIEFYLATVDPAGNPTTGITRSTNDTWYTDGGSYWNSLAWDTNRYLNIYTNNASGNLGYVPDIPQGGNLVGSPADRVVVLYSTFGRNGSFGPPYNLGRTTTHEVGHYLGLFHTFDFGCGSSSACYTSGDRICDTNRESSPHTTCNSSATSCSSLDPIHNYMDYSYDSCMNQFTLEQSRRMRCTLQFWRSQLAAECALATVTSRNGGTNPASYTASTMVIGELFTGSLDVGSTGHTIGQLFGCAQPTLLTLFNGTTLLADLATPPGNIMPLPSSAGPIAQASFTLPFDTALCGLTIYTQGIHFGGAPDFSLSNAQDLVVGLE